MILIAQYLLTGLFISFLIELAIRATNQDVSFWERYAMIVLWPIMLIIFIIYFIKGLFED